MSIEAILNTAKSVEWVCTHRQIIIATRGTTQMTREKDEVSLEPSMEIGMKLNI